MLVRMPVHHRIASLAITSLTFLARPSAAQLVAVPVRIAAQQPVHRYELYWRDASIGRDPPLVTCSSACAMMVWPGHYRMRLVQADGRSLATRPFRIDGASMVSVDNDIAAKRDAGIALVVAGAAFTVGGAFILASNIPQISADGSQPHCEATSSCQRGNAAAALTGLCLMVGGIASHAVGWVIFGRSFKASVVVDPLVVSPPPAALVRWSVGGAPLAGGGALALGATF